MVMCVCVDIAPGMYLCVLHALMVCSLCYIVVPTILGGPLHCAKLVLLHIYICVTVHLCLQEGALM